MPEYDLEGLRSTYDRIASDFVSDSSKGVWRHWIRITKKFTSLLPENGRILDAGCGAGFQAEWLIKHGFRVLGIDFSERLLREAKKKVPKATFRLMDIRQLDFPNNTFDGILCRAVLLHIPRKETPRVLHGFQKVLKPNGVLEVDFKSGKGEALVQDNEYGYDYERYFVYYSPNEMRRLMEEAGFRVIRRDGFRSPTSRWVTIIARKK